MKSTDIVATAAGNTLRSKARTLLTVVAIFIGAFTLTLTSGLGVGINKYIDTLLQGFGSEDQIYVMKTADQASGTSQEGPQEYDPEAAQTSSMFGGSDMLTEKDIEKIEAKAEKTGERLRLMFANLETTMSRSKAQGDAMMAMMMRF